MMKKMLIIFISLFIITGCSVSYEMTVNEDLSVEELIFFVENNEHLLQYGTDVSSVIDEMTGYFFDFNLDIKPKILINNNNFKNRNIGDIESNIYLRKEFLNIDNYAYSTFLTYYFDTHEIEKKNNLYTFYATGFDFNKLKAVINDYKYKFNFKTLNVRMTIPFDVLDSTADIIEAETNTFIWVLKEEDIESKEIRITFNTSSKFGDEKKENNIIADIGKVIIETVTGKEVDDDSKASRVVGIIVFGIVITLITLTIILVKRKIDKKNEI